MTKWSSTFQAGRMACANKRRREQPGHADVSKQVSKARGQSWRKVSREGMGKLGSIRSRSSSVFTLKKHLPIANASEDPVLLFSVSHTSQTPSCLGAFSILNTSTTFFLRHLCVCLLPTNHQLISALIWPSQKGTLQLNLKLIHLFFSCHSVLFSS